MDLKRNFGSKNQIEPIPNKFSQLDSELQNEQASTLTSSNLVMFENPEEIFEFPFSGIHIDQNISSLNQYFDHDQLQQLIQNPLTSPKISTMNDQIVANDLSMVQNNNLPMAQNTPPIINISFFKNCSMIQYPNLISMNNGNVKGTFQNNHPIIDRNQSAQNSYLPCTLNKYSPNRLPTQSLISNTN